MPDETVCQRSQLKKWKCSCWFLPDTAVLSLILSQNTTLISHKKQHLIFDVSDFLILTFLKVLPIIETQLLHFNVKDIHWCGFISKPCSYLSAVFELERIWRSGLNMHSERFLIVVEPTSPLKSSVTLLYQIACSLFIALHIKRTNRLHLYV